MRIGMANDCMARVSMEEVRLRVTTQHSFFDHMPAARPQILMCPPDHYGIEYEINPWMSRERQTDRKLAVEQWTALAAMLRTLGVEILLLDPVQGLPDL